MPALFSESCGSKWEYLSGSRQEHFVHFLCVALCVEQDSCVLIGAAQSFFCGILMRRIGDALFLWGQNGRI